MPAPDGGDDLSGSAVQVKGLEWFVCATERLMVAPVEIDDASEHRNRALYKSADGGA